MEILATFILVSGVIDDLRSQKVHNYLVISLFVITIVALIVLSGFSGLIAGSYGFFLALGFAFPLYLAKVLGAGDAKLFAVFGLATNTHAVLQVAIFSMVWGALIGVVRAILNGNFKTLILSTAQLRWTKSPGQEQFRIPFTVAMLFGWMTHLTLVQAGVYLW